MRKVTSTKQQGTSPFSRTRLDAIVRDIRFQMQSPTLRALSHRDLQTALWETVPSIQTYMADCRQAEHHVRSQLFSRIHRLLKNGPNNDNLTHRLYLVLKQYGWAADFTTQYNHPIPDTLPNKAIQARVSVVGLGIGGSLAASGLAKHGIQVTGYEKRSKGMNGVSIRYQNSSWTGYGISQKLLNEPAYDEMTQFRQHIHTKDGKIITTDRVQIIIGDAIRVALDSADRYGADLHFGANRTLKRYMDDAPDIVALFTGAHTDRIFNLSTAMGMESWPELQSDCITWLQINPSNRGNYLSRGGEVGAEHWDFTIESTRHQLQDLDRVYANVKKQIKQKLSASNESIDEDLAHLQKLEHIKKKVQQEGSHFDYTFTNAPINDHNRKKRQSAEDNVILDGGYSVDVKMAAQSVLSSPESETILVTGGDATVPPNPLAAYGATLAVYFANMLVDLSVAIGHLNTSPECDNKESNALKQLFVDHYQCRGRSENYFQFIQTLICNLYSLPTN